MYKTYIYTGWRHIGCLADGARDGGMEGWREVINSFTDFQYTNGNRIVVLAVYSSLYMVTITVIIVFLDV
jgi:hypothetical protein